MRKLWLFAKKEMVLTVATLLAIVSAFLIKPDKGYLEYVDVRTLCLLFCLMAVMGGFQRLGLFRMVAQGMLKKVGTGSVQVTLVLVLLSFSFSMLITNDVGLITFVPFTFTVLELLGEEKRNRLIIPVVVLETLGANLGSMLTPIGNPQNLYLYGKAGLGVGEFLLLTLPLTCLAAVLLVIWSVAVGKRSGGVASSKMGDGVQQAESAAPAGMENGTRQEESAAAAGVEAGMQQTESAPKAAASKGDGNVSGAGRIALVSGYAVLFILCLLTVARVLDYPVTLAITLAAVLIFDRKTLGMVDYFLLLTFVAFFVFIGNMGRIPAFAGFLERIVAGREVPVAVLASQGISNVPAALLLSGFTENYRALIIGVNLGGMGTLIASMASLISYKYVAKLMPEKKGKYFWYFTIVSLCFLAVLMMGYYGMKALGIC